MSKLTGYAGSILTVDLTSGHIASMPLPSELIARFIGGAGVNAWLAYKWIEPRTAPLSAGNALLLGVGPLVGTLVPGAGKSNVTAKSPLSNLFGTSGSGHMGTLKFTGHDHLVITGRAQRPVYLEVGDDIKIREASHLWGEDTWEATEMIWHELGRTYAVASIGPAGENLVRDASIIANKYSAFAKTGMGAVMGSKNLKAIAICGGQAVAVAEPTKFIRLTDALCEEIRRQPEFHTFRDRGSLMGLKGMLRRIGAAISYKNCQQVADEELMSGFRLERLDGLLEERSNLSCLACPVGCKKSLLFKTESGSQWSLPLSCALAPVYSIAGPCAIGEWAEAYECAEICNRLGMDYASASLVAMAIELYQRDIIDKKDTDGLELDWTPAVVTELLRKTAYRDGFGDVLADGLLGAPRRIGRGSEYYALHYKGVGNCVMADPRPLFPSWLFSMIVNPTGNAVSARVFSDARRDRLEYELGRMGMPEDDLRRVFSGRGGYDLAKLVKWTEDYGFALECLGVCLHDLFQRIDINVWADVYCAATGVRMDGAGLLEAAARGRDVRKAFNIREGASRKDDTVPDRFMSEPVMAGSKRFPPLDRDSLDELVTAYYKERGWDPQAGTLSPERLVEVTH